MIIVQRENVLTYALSFVTGTAIITIGLVTAPIISGIELRFLDSILGTKMTVVSPEQIVLIATAILISSLVLLYYNERQPKKYKLFFEVK